MCYLPIQISIRRQRRPTVFIPRKQSSTLMKSQFQRRNSRRKSHSNKLQKLSSVSRNQNRMRLKWIARPWCPSILFSTSLQMVNKHWQRSSKKRHHPHHPKAKSIIVASHLVSANGRRRNTFANIAAENSPSPTTFSFTSGRTPTSVHSTVIFAEKLLGNPILPDVYKYLASHCPPNWFSQWTVFNMLFSFTDDKTTWETTDTSTPKRNRSNAKIAARVFASRGHLLSIGSSIWRRVPTDVHHVEKLSINARTSRPTCSRTPNRSHFHVAIVTKFSEGIVISEGTGSPTFPQWATCYKASKHLDRSRYLFITDSFTMFIEPE